MKALIFAAGVGSRLKPWTDEHPKALVPVAGVPMLQRVILKLKAAGISEMVVNVHHFSHQIIDFLRQNNNFGVAIHISDESDLLLDTGGGMLKARHWLDDDEFVVHNADILTDLPLAAMIQAHAASDAIATLLVAERATSRYLLFDQSLRMRGWTNVSTGEIKPKGIDLERLTPLAFGGVHICSPKIFSYLEQFAQQQPSSVFSIMPFYIDACGQIMINGYLSPTPYMWHDIGKPAALDTANQVLSTS